MTKHIKDFRTQVKLQLAETKNKDKQLILECLDNPNMKDWLLGAVLPCNKVFEKMFWQKNVDNFGKYIDVCGHWAEINWAFETLYPEAYAEALETFILEQANDDRFLVFETLDEYPDIFQVADFLDEIESDDFQQAFYESLREPLDFTGATEGDR